VQRAGVLAGEDVLDVACGTGSAGIRAAQSGARVVGLDLTPPLFDASRREAVQAGTDARWVSGVAAGQTPDQAEPPLAWGNEAHVRSLFAGSGVRLSFSREIARHPLHGVGALAEPLEHHAGVVGPLIALRRAAGRRGSWRAVLAEVAALCAADGVRADGHYLVVLGRKDG
jgi:SAM-dependent methyltransferase